MLPRHILFLPVLALSLPALGPSLVLGQNPSPNEASLIEFFERKIRPVLVDNCFNCHSANTNSKGGLRVDDRLGLINGGGRGPAVVPGHPEKSLLLKAVRHEHPQVKMPPKKHLSDAEIADLARWIKDGAAWPQPRIPAALGKPNPAYEKLRKEHWAWQPLRRPEVPQVKDQTWPRDDVDRFLLAELAKKNLQPVADAAPLTLLRRLTFDLTGLPPSPEEMENFIADCQMQKAELPTQSAISNLQSAIQKVVDRLLASPAFGERWGRHWLDVARYGESTGSARNLPYPHAWRYRDYVIDAFNKDKPFDQFIREQIAGDLLPHASQAQRDEQLVATGFLALGVKDVNQRFKVRYVMDNIDEQIDVVSRAVLALTASCARCHDHKFDPIPMTDYYALAGIFHSSDDCSGLRNKMGGGGLDYYHPQMLLVLSGKKNDPKLAERLGQAKAALDMARADLVRLTDDPTIAKAGPEREKKLATARQQVNKLQAALLALNDPAMQGPVALGVRDAQTVGDTEIRIRGEAEKLGPAVQRGYLSLLNVPDAPQINPKQSGRLELAQWLTSPHNPLTARVAVNRVWKHLFGQGLVASVDNFGVTGEKPSHPDLLDHLAARFVKDGWSVKKLIRSLVLSRAYQLGTETTPAHLTADPANRLLWRHSPRRLDAEEIRDAMLAVAGSLDRGRPKGSPAMDLKVIELSNVSPLAKKLEEEGRKCLHRSVYLPLLRTLTPRALEVFDFAEQGLVTGSRDSTTVPTQALYLLNDPFVRQQAQGLAQRVLNTEAKDDAQRITLAYGLTLGRNATPKEIERSQSYLQDYEAAAQEENRKLPPRIAAWTSFSQALLAAAEFRFVR